MTMVDPSPTPELSDVQSDDMPTHWVDPYNEGDTPKAYCQFRELPKMSSDKMKVTCLRCVKKMQQWGHY